MLTLKRILSLSTLALVAACSPAADEPTQGGYADGKGDQASAAYDASQLDEADFEDRISQTEDAALEEEALTLDGPLIQATLPTPYRASKGDDFDTIDVTPRKDGDTYRVDATIKISDQGNGIDWSSVRMKGSKGILSFNLSVNESWKQKAAGQIAVRNYAIPNCKKNSSFILNLCKFSAHVYVKDGKGVESHMRYYVNVKMP